MSGTVLSGAALSRRFVAVTALRDADLDIDAGEAVALLGPNGAGKTTLMRLIATLLRPSSGSLQLFQRPLRDGGAQARRRIGFLAHQSLLYPDLTATENLEFYARMFGVPAAAARVRSLLDEVGLLGWAHRPVRTLSRGLEQRCALARALLHEPDLLLLDEPFTGLDVDAAAMLAQMIRGVRQRGSTVLMTTHDLGRAAELCERAVVLVRGRVCYDGHIPSAHDSPPVEALEHLYQTVVRDAEAQRQ